MNTARTLVSATRSRLRSIRVLPFFVRHTDRTIAQMRKADGFVAGSGSSPLREEGSPLTLRPLRRIHQPARKPLGVRFPQAAGSVNQLALASILTERTGYSRNGMYSVREALAIINRPFGEEALLPND